MIEFSGADVKIILISNKRLMSQNFPLCSSAQYLCVCSQCRAIVASSTLIQTYVDNDLEETTSLPRWAYKGIRCENGHFIPLGPETSRLPLSTKFISLNSCEN